MSCGMIRVSLLRNRSDGSNPYVRALVRFAQRHFGDLLLLDEADETMGPFVMEAPAALIRPFGAYVCFTDPVFDLEGYSTYFSEHRFHVPPVVRAVIRHLWDNHLLRRSHGVAGSGIGLFLAKRLKEMGVRVTLLSHRDLARMGREEIEELGVINCTSGSFDGCLINLSDNPREVSALTVRYLYRNLFDALNELKRRGVLTDWEEPVNQPVAELA
ncbi:hypothetical protein TheveDRAFT_1627 [Thermanaerovibrio velox DSM 12556]|uniref:Uncharacterized protein n=1 Tax=Thermanaerovibrio velox DSM 12556 TaxID=926567 RepID=H0UQA7_9BACT|nr:SDR family oxidoreductase [Thermanaerovibrio velox]EHM10745.1 hypothetical protein TheveDRAFT_1627 [Thermanaerovibrio velox DSM 12556]